MAAGEPKLSPITVTPDDGDDVVIQAGARPSRVPSVPHDLKPEKEAPARSKRGGGPSNGQDGQPQGAQGERFRETTIEDLQAPPMPLAQKIVLSLAAVGVIAIIAWFLFVR